MRYGLPRSPSPSPTRRYARAHRTARQATTNQNPRTSRRRSTFDLPSDSESGVEEPPIDSESELSSRSVISGESDSAQAETEVTAEKRSAILLAMIAAKLPDWHDSRISGRFFREARVAIRRVACADSDSLHGRGRHCMERGAMHQGDGIPDQRRDAERGFVGSCYTCIRVRYIRFLPDPKLALGQVIDLQ